MRTLTLLLGIVCSTATYAISANAQSRPETCGNTNGAAWCSVSGGQPPYTYAWTGPNGYTATTDSIFDLVGGTYSVTVTDNVGATATANTWVVSQSYLPDGVGPTLAGAMALTGYWGGACLGQCNGAGAFADHVVHGAASPYTYSVPGNYLGYNAEVGGPVYGGWCYGDWVSYSFSDASGCTGMGSFSVYGVDEGWYTELESVQGSCNGNTGAVQLLSHGYESALHTLWLNGQAIGSAVGYTNTPISFTGLAPGDYTLNVSFQYTQCAQPPLSINVPDLGPNCSSVSGNSWYDVDADCVRDANEVGVPGSVLAIQPGGYFALTQANGNYLLNLPAGSYTLAQTDASLIPICPATMPVPFTINGAPVALPLASGSTLPLDLGIHAGTAFARPGFATQLHATARNHSPQPSGPVTVTCTYDAALTYVGATPAPTVSGNTLTWQLPAFNSFGTAGLQVNLHVPASTPLGTQLVSTWTVSNTLPDAVASNDTHTTTRTVTGSYDPNVKEVRTSSGQSDTQYILGTDNYLDYTIHFQNTGTDTAFTVVVTDTLDATLNMASFQQGTSSHACTVDFLPGRVVRWTFNNILLVDSTTNEAGSHGLTSFRIRLAEPIVPGTLIANAADIFFDFNPPIRTPDALITADFATGLAPAARSTVQLVPNPAHDRLTVVGAAGATRLRVRAADGRTVLEHALRNGPTVELGALPAGLYTAEVFDAAGAVQVLRLVKQ